MTSQTRVSDLWDKYYTLTWSTEGVTPLDLLSKGAAILIISVFFGLFYPGVIAYSTGMFFKTDVERTLDAIATVHNPENCTSQELKDCKLQELKHFRSQQLLISNGIKNIDVYLTGLADNPSKLADVQAAIALRQFLQAQKNEAVPPVGTNAFYLGSTMLLWPAFFALVGWLIFIFPPRLGQDALQQLTSKRVLFLWLFIFIFYRWPTWWRNTPLGEEGRKFFGNANFDIDRIGFFVQETLGAGVALLLAVLWLQWSAYYTQVRVQLSARAGREPVEEALKPELAEDLSMMFLHWQIASALIAVILLVHDIFLANRDGRQ